MIDMHAEKFELNFGWHKERYIYNFTEFYKISKYEQILECIYKISVNSDFQNSLRLSIVYLWAEARQCYVFGAFQSCILTCGAVVERYLKLEYAKTRGDLVKEERLTLGKMIQKCRGVVDQNLLELAKEILEPRNSRAHALLESSSPELAILGGSERGIEIRSLRHYLIEPYRGEAKRVVELTARILGRPCGAS